MNAEQESLILRNQEAIIQACLVLVGRQAAERKVLQDQLTDTRARIVTLHAHMKRKAKAS